MATKMSPTRAAARTGSPPADLTLAEGTCLTLVAQKVSHGWAIGTALAPEGDIGRIWSLSRALVYRTIEGLADKNLVIRHERERDRGRERAMLATTAAGRRASARWLDEPVRHLRDVRTELLVKLSLRSRAGLDNASFLAAQRAVLGPKIDALTAGAERDIVDVWRREHARAVRRFLDDAQHPGRGDAALRPEMRLSARNQLRARVVSVQRGELMATVKGVLGDGQQLTATITKEAADDLDLAAGDTVLLIVKATEVMVAKASDHPRERPSDASSRTRLAARRR